MPEVEKVIKLLAAFGIPLGVVMGVVATLVLLHLYPQLKLFMADLLRVLGRCAKFVRRASLEYELEGVINTFGKGLNEEVSLPLLPACDVKWVKAKTPVASLVSGKAIVRMSFGDNHDQNLYNAARAFVNSALLPETKPFLRRATADAVDLLVTRDLVRQSRRRALRIFNEEFGEADQECKEQYYRLEEIEDACLFKRILIPEYHFLGETLGDKSPRPSYEQEADSFLQWLHQLATRESEEMSQLAFFRENMRVGVILVASSETYSEHGLEPYVRRAGLYASQEFSCVYLLARGSSKGSVAERIAEELCSHHCFENLTKRPRVIRGPIGGDDEKLVVTCVCLRPNRVAMVQSAWERCSQALAAGETIVGTICSVDKRGVSVDVYGIRSTVESKHLSAMEEIDPLRYFRKYGELSLKVLECRKESDLLVLSNVSTDTDPKLLVDQLSEHVDEPLEATVTQIITNKDGHEVGFRVELKDIPFKGFVPREMATYSRFELLSNKYPVGSRITVNVECFKPAFGNYVAGVAGLEDPWKSISKCRVGEVVRSTIRQVSQRCIVGEIAPGLETVCWSGELTWDDSSELGEQLKSYSLGQPLDGRVLRIDENRKTVFISAKRVNKSPAEQFADRNLGTLVTGSVSKVSENGADITLEDADVRAYLHKSELTWSYTSDATHLLNTGEQLRMKVIGYDGRYDSVRLSRKQCLLNHFAEFMNSHKQGDIVTGTVESLAPDRAHVVVKFGSDRQVVAYVHKAEMSNVLFVDDAMLGKMVSCGDVLTFSIKAFYPNVQIVELSRRVILRERVHQLEYGEEYQLRVVDHTRKGIYAYSDALEGILDCQGLTAERGRVIRVIPARIDRERAKVELQVVEADTTPR